MTQITTGVRALLSLSRVYNLWDWVLGATAARIEFVDEHLKVQDRNTVLDLGCGTASLLTALPVGIEYTGFDISEDYLASARKQFGERGTFLHVDVGEDPPVPEGHFDLAVAVGVLHHLDDHSAEKLVEVAWQALKEGGRFVTVDPLFEEGQPRVARWLISRDRGQHVRQQPDYEDLLKGRFGGIETNIRHDRLRIPYTHIIMTAAKRV